MSKYELNDEQVKTLKLIILNADIKGRDSLAVLGLFKALDSPIDDNAKEDIKKKKKIDEDT